MITPSSYPRRPPSSPTAVNTGTSTESTPIRQPDPDANNPVDAIDSTPGSRSGVTTTPNTITVGQPADQSNSSDLANSFTASNQTNSGAALTTPAENQANLDAIAARKSGVLGCLGKSPGTTPGCNNPCDTVNCLEKMLVGNLLDLDAKKLLCDMTSSTERALKRKIDSLGDQLLAATQELTSLAPVIAPLNTLQSFVNKIDPGAVANCLGAQALKDKVNGQFNKAKNTVNKFQKGYQDKIAKGFNDTTAAAQQFSITPNQCASKTPASLGALIG